MKLAFVHHHDLSQTAPCAAGGIGVHGAAANIARLTRELAEPDGFLNLAGARNRPAPWVWPRLLLGNWLRSRVYWGWAEPSLSRSYGRQFSRRLARQRLAVEALVAAEVKHVAYIQHPVPKLLWTDSLYGGLLDFYEYCRPLGPLTRWHLQQLDRAAVRNCKLLVFSSAWAAERARQLYGVPLRQTRVIPFGPNLIEPVTETDVARYLAARSPDRCQLLWIGADWERKGGPLALAAAGALGAAGIPVQLTVAGLSRPPAGMIWPNWVRDLGVLNLGLDADRQRLAAAYQTAHWLLLPTLADCTPHVICEAGQFGVPSLASAVGGLPSLVRPERNGQLFAATATAQDYADYLRVLWRDRARYEALAQQSFAEYQQRLNWQTAGLELQKVLADITHPKSELLAA